MQKGHPPSKNWHATRPAMELEWSKSAGYEQHELRMFRSEPCGGWRLWENAISGASTRSVHRSGLASSLGRISPAEIRHGAWLTIELGLGQKSKQWVACFSLSGDEGDGTLKMKRERSQLSKACYFAATTSGVVYEHSLAVSQKMVRRIFSPIQLFSGCLPFFFFLIN